MAKKKTKKREKKSRRDPPPKSDESRAAEAITVAWMLALIATLAAEVVAFVGWALVALANHGADVPAQVRMVLGLLLATSALTGIVCLALIPAVYRLRRAAPPRAVTIAAVAISSVPILTVVWFSVAGWK